MSDQYPIPASALCGASFHPGSEVTYNGRKGKVIDWDHNEYGAAIYVEFEDGAQETFVSSGDFLILKRSQAKGK